MELAQADYYPSCPFRSVLFEYRVFIGFRFAWSVALATLASIAQDLLLVSAIFALLKLEDVTYVARYVDGHATP